MIAHSAAACLTACAGRASAARGPVSLHRRGLRVLGQAVSLRHRGAYAADFLKWIDASHPAARSQGPRSWAPLRPTSGHNRMMRECLAAVCWVVLPVRPAGQAAPSWANCLAARASRATPWSAGRGIKPFLLAVRKQNASTCTYSRTRVLLAVAIEGGAPGVQLQAAGVRSPCIFAGPPGDSRAGPSGGVERPAVSAEPEPDQWASEGPPWCPLIGGTKRRECGQGRP